ncbi:sulfite exporter TauE/SafE family protein [Candidatus Woesearchaeota archaeon]|nr:sulfite exporter TauE/SafE family protein [Candidatus Woesearchaeota archaeon]
MIELLFILLGILAGAISGLIGIGGGVLIVPALVYLFGFTQHKAQGTTLALLVVPVGFLAALIYYKAGHVDLRIAALIAIGFFIGCLFGAKFAVSLPDIYLQRIFGVALFILALRMIFSK